MALVFVHQAHCDDQVCPRFGQRGNCILALSPLWEREALVAFLKQPCATCGQQVRVDTSPIGQEHEAFYAGYPKGPTRILP